MSSEVPNLPQKRSAEHIEQPPSKMQKTEQSTDSAYANTSTNYSEEHLHSQLKQLQQEVARLHEQLQQQQKQHQQEITQLQQQQQQQQEQITQLQQQLKQQRNQQQSPSQREQQREQQQSESNKQTESQREHIQEHPPKHYGGIISLSKASEQQLNEFKIIASNKDVMQTIGRDGNAWDSDYVNDLVRSSIQDNRGSPDQRNYWHWLISCAREQGGA